jgi:uncharacterized protein YecT (DUF1311 family)
MVTISGVKSSRYYFLLLAGLLLCNIAFSQQYGKTIDSLKQSEKVCLDKGWRMPACAYQYYIAIDSLLNDVYYKLQQSLNADSKIELRSEQRLWLKKREAFFKEQDKQFQDSLHAGAYGPEMRVIPMGAKTNFIEARVLILVKRLPANMQ